MYFLGNPIHDTEFCCPKLPRTIINLIAINTSYEIFKYIFPAEVLREVFDGKSGTAKDKEAIKVFCGYMRRTQGTFSTW